MANRNAESERQIRHVKPIDGHKAIVTTGDTRLEVGIVVRDGKCRLRFDMPCDAVLRLTPDETKT